MIRIVQFSLLCLAAVSAGLLHAHSDMDKPLYVAADGEDTGRCLDAARPCATIRYALERVGKGGQIRVAAGRYELSDPADVFHLVSGIVDVRGGFDRQSGFRQPGIADSTLLGVPAAYRSVFASRGFHVVADRKHPDSRDEAETRRLLKLHASMQASIAAAPCTNGSVNGLDCENTSLLAHVPFADVSAAPGAAADVWGFVDLNSGREYAIVGYNTGTAVFDVTDPGNPREVGFVDGQQTTWRDIKVYQYFDAAEGRWNANAYVTTDGSGDGLFVIDLTDLPQRIRRVGYASDFSAAHNVFAANTDYATGVSLTGGTPTLIIAGSNNDGGRFRSYSLAVPDNPVFLGMPNVSSNDYMHDAASMIITDTRKDTQCVNAGNYCEVLFDFNESTVDIWDISNASNPVRLSRTPYNNAAYTHSGWPSEDGMYLFVHDELDEQGFGLNTTVRTLSLADLTAPAVVGGWTGPTRAIDHNGFVRGNRYYMSNYSRGLTVLDITDPLQPQPAGRLDSYPFSNNTSFVGAWGAYPYFASGNVALSDMSSGFYMIGDETLASPNGTLGFTATSFAATEGGSATVTVSRSGGSSGSVSVDYAIIPLTADSADLVSQTGTLSWADGISGNRTLILDTLADGTPEGLQRLLVRLIAPTGGATLAPGSIASVYIADPGDGAVVEFDRALIDVTERGFATAVAVVRRSGTAIGSVSVDWAISGGDATPGSDFQGPTSGSMSWADGDADPQWIEFAVVDDGSGEPDEFFEIALSAASGGNVGTTGVMRVDLLDGAGSNQAPNAVAGASQTVGPGATVTLDGAASNDPDGDMLDYRWTQLLGPAVTLADDTAATTQFTAPDVGSDMLLQFRLEVSDARGLSDESTTNITVTANGSGFGGGGGGGATDALLLSLLLAAGAGAMRRNAIRRGAA